MPLKPGLAVTASSQGIRFPDQDPPNGGSSEQISYNLGSALAELGKNQVPILNNLSVFVRLAK
jgi:hypothetical protein